MLHRGKFVLTSFLKEWQLEVVTETGRWKDRSKGTGVREHTCTFLS